MTTPQINSIGWSLLRFDSDRRFLERMKGNSLSMTISSLAVKIASAVLVFAFLSSRVAEAEYIYAYDEVRVDHYAGYGASSSGNGIIAVNYAGHPSSYSFSDTLTETGGTSEVTHGYANVAVVLTPIAGITFFGDGAGISQSRNATGPPAQLVIRVGNGGGSETPGFTWQGGTCSGLARMHFTLSGHVGPRAGDYCQFDAWAEFHAHDGTDVPLELHWVNSQPGSVFSGVDLYVEAPMTFNSDGLDIIAQVNFTVVDPGGDGSLSAVGSTVSAPSTTPHPAFFNGETALGGGWYYLQFPNGTPFGYYSYLPEPHFIYHIDLGFEYWFDANDGHSGIFFYDFASSSFFYTSPSTFPYLYDFSLNAWLYYVPDFNNPGRYSHNPRWFYNFATGQWITL